MNMTKKQRQDILQIKEIVIQKQIRLILKMFMILLIEQQIQNMIHLILKIL